MAMATAVNSNEKDQSKLEMKERNYFQMIEVLMTRLKKMEEKVDERRRACADDQNADSDFCSSMVTGMQQDLHDIVDDQGQGGKGGGNQRHSLFAVRHGTPDAGGAADGAWHGIVPEVNVTWRYEPPTDFGKRLEQKFEVELGGGRPIGGGVGGKKGARSGAGGNISKSRRMGQRKMDEKKQERVKYEKKLQTNLENFVTRSVGDVTYVLPGKSGVGAMPTIAEDKSQASNIQRQNEFTSPLGKDSDGAARIPTVGAEGAGGGDGPVDVDGGRFDTSSFPSPTSMDEFSVSAESSVTKASRASYASSTGSTLIEDEEWPIEISAHEFNPKLLLSLACERITLPSGDRMFKHFVLGQKSCWLFVYMYWFVHCKFFQEDSIREQEHLLECVSTIYVQILSLRALEAHKDFFFKFYPFVVANAVHAGFTYLCPGSRHLYNKAFKRILYLQAAQVLTGVDVCPVSVQVLRSKLFPDELAEEAAEMANPETGPSGELEDGLPPLPQAKKQSAGSQDSSAQRQLLMMQTPQEGFVGSRGGTPTAGHGAAVMARSASAPPGSFENNGASNDDDDDDDAAAAGGLLATRRMGSDSQLMAANGNGAGGSLSSTAAALPLRHFTGRRDELRFNPEMPATLVRALPRQQRVKFDAAGISPMLQQYLEHPTASLVGRKPENMGRTTPVRWCSTGGSDTFRKMENRKQIHDDLSMKHKKMKEEYRLANLKQHKDTMKALKKIEKEKKRVYKGGAVSVGRYSLDLVAEISQRSKEGALKRMEREKKRDQEREDLEKERKKKELEERKKKKEARTAAAGS